MNASTVLLNLIHVSKISLVSTIFPLITGSGSCPECGVSLKRNNFRLQLFEDASVEKEVDIRKRILRDYNKKEEDFDSLNEYNDYLEEIETIIYNLSNNIDVPETNRRIEQYKKENKESIIRNKIKFNKDVLELERLIEEEQQHEINKREMLEKQEIEAKRRKIMEKEALIDELMFSDNDAKEILNFFAENKHQASTDVMDGEMKSVKKETIKRASYFSTGVKIGDNQIFSHTLPKIEEGPLYVYVEPEVVVEGPPYPSWNDLEAMGYLRHVRQESLDERAGGFMSSLACMRALQESMCGLYNISKKSEVSSAIA